MRLCHGLSGADGSEWIQTLRIFVDRAKPIELREETLCAQL